MKILKKRNSTRHIVRTDDGALVAAYGMVKDMRTFTVFHVAHVSTDDKGRMWIGAMRGSHGQRLKAAPDVQYAGPIPEPTEDEA